MPPRTLPSIPSLRAASSRLPHRLISASQRRFVNTDKEELGGVGGSEPPGPQKNPVNWRAGTITAVGVGLAGLWMYRAKTKS
ncbi:hypothetical protein N656DRAFT_847244 [Canariomyces notabilis]|uniref:Uncharacterized protein n=1 Tax=Canariomyces notabilis TaxID=2074819 RepID=A0AAN6T9H3_9PEZI|nr:hypothetical protein N656DRAFT_847244 [Canariomyces arenarius]